MASRSNPTAVKVVISTTLTDPQIQAFLDDADLWVTQHLVGEGLGTAELTAIEKYLACYFITFRDPRLTSGTLDDVKETYQRDAKQSEYLRLAMGLDPTGKVEDAFAGDNKVKVRYRFGQTYTERAAEEGPAWWEA